MLLLFSIFKKKSSLFFSYFFIILFFITSQALAQSCHGKRPGLSRIVGGEAAKLEHWPGYVVLKYKEGSRRKLLCGGTAIASQWILTAAHCFYDRNGNRVIYPGNAEGTSHPENLGQRDISNIHEVSNIIIHPEYNFFSDKNDIALVKIENFINSPYATLSMDSKNDPATGQNVWTAGFGDLKEGGDESDKLQEVMLPIVSTQVCKQVSSSSVNYSALTHRQICAGLKEDGKDSCQGDSGGPLVALNQNSCPYQVGIVSVGDGCARAGKYGIYTRVSKYADFIRKYVFEVQSIALVERTKQQKIEENIVFARKFLKELSELLENSILRRVSLNILRKDGEIFSEKIKMAENFVFRIKSKIKGNVILLDINAYGTITPIFPNKYIHSQYSGVITAYHNITIPDNSRHNYGFNYFSAKGPAGKGFLLALVVPLDFDITKVLSPSNIKDKAFEPIKHEKSYFMNSLSQILYFLRSNRSRTKEWGMAISNYEVMPL